MSDGTGELEPWYTLDLEVRPEHRETFLRVLHDVVGASRQEDGVLQYDLLQNRSHDCRFTLVQRYASLDAVRWHMAQPHAVAALQQMEQLLAAPPVQRDWVASDG